MKYLQLLLKAKGPRALAHRALSLFDGYGMTPGKYEQALQSLVSAIDRFGCRATFPITSVALERHPDVIQRMQEEKGIEFAVHGLFHVDMENYTLDEQLEHLTRARAIFERNRITARGFRSPYLRRNGTIRQAAEATGFEYISNQSVLWDVAKPETAGVERAHAYQVATDFYAPWLAHQVLSLPVAYDKIVEIPVSLPDDEMLVERLGAGPAQIAEAWIKMLRDTYAWGELFTIQLHPERSAICTPAVIEVLAEADCQDPPVWVARMDEIAHWWKQRQATHLDVQPEGDNQYRVTVEGPAEAGVAVRYADAGAPALPWSGAYTLVRERSFSVRAASRPTVGVSTRSHPDLARFLEQQGYPVDVIGGREGRAVYLDRPDFARTDERAVVREVETARTPLVRLKRWPGRAQSALAITGDIDALTLWDYGWRLLGK